MPLPPVSPLSRFAFGLLLVGVALVFAMLWVLNHLPAPPKARPKPRGTPMAAPAPAKASPSPPEAVQRDPDHLRR